MSIVWTGDRHDFKLTCDLTPAAKLGPLVFHILFSLFGSLSATVGLMSKFRIKTSANADLLSLHF